MTKMDVMSINIHRMFEYLFCADESSSFLNLRFENDVKMYGTQTIRFSFSIACPFENDVKMYGTQTKVFCCRVYFWFENDVKMYGTQTLIWGSKGDGAFENDVKMYGTQTIHLSLMNENSLRMM